MSLWSAPCTDLKACVYAVLHADTSPKMEPHLLFFGKSQNCNRLRCATSSCFLSPSLHSPSLYPLPPLSLSLSPQVTTDQFTVILDVFDQNTLVSERSWIHCWQRKLCPVSIFVVQYFFFCLILTTWLTCIVMGNHCGKGVIVVRDVFISLVFLTVSNLWIFLRWQS